MSRRTVLVVVLLAAALASFTPPPFFGGGDGPPPPPVAVFMVEGSAKMDHYHGGVGQKANFKNKISNDDVSACAQGQANGCIVGVTVPSNPDGTGWYLFIDSINTTFPVGVTQARIASRADGSNGTALTGYMAGDGKFIFLGTDPLSGVSYYAEGKAKWDKAQLQQGNPVPVSMKGKFKAVSGDDEHIASGKFKTIPVGG